MNDQYISLLVQVPLVGIFIYFTLRLISIFNATIEKRDDAWQTAIEKRDQEWRIFLSEQRTASNETIVALGARFGNEIKDVGEKVATLTGILLAHDARELVRRKDGQP